MAAALSVALSGCGVALSNRIEGAKTSAELAQFSDRQMCHPLVDSTPIIAQERLRRGLGDCSPEHEKCAQSGFPLGHPQYLECRQIMAAGAARRDEASARQSEALMLYGQQLANPPRLPSVTCNRFGSTTTCRQY